MVPPDCVCNGHLAVRGSDHIPGARPHSARSSTRPEVPLHPKGRRSHLLSHLVKIAAYRPGVLFPL